MTNFAQNTCYTETYLDFSGMFFCCGDEENGCHACVCRHLTAADQRRNVLYRFRIGIKG